MRPLDRVPHDPRGFEGEPSGLRFQAAPPRLAEAGPRRPATIPFVAVRQVLERRRDECLMASRPSAEEDPPPLDERFTETVQPVVRRLVRVSRRILGSEDLAWDAVQEALLSLWRQDPPPSDPRAWLIRTVFHRSLHLARTLRRRLGHEARACHSRPEASSRDDPSRLIPAAETSDVLMEVLSKLGEKHRQVLTLLLIEEMDYESIARALDIPIGTVRSRLNRSRTAIREILEGEFPQDQFSDG